MKNKIFKVSIVLAIILTMTMSNFILVGSGLLSFALDDVSTNNSNVEFNSYFKNEKGEKISNLDISTSNKEANLYLYLNVKKEGYLEGTINLENTNFRLKESASEYVNNIENNIITLNQINAGTTAEIEVKVEFVKNQPFNLNSLNQESEIKLNGIYHDSSKKEKEITATRKLNLRLVSDVKVENVVNDLQIITNKVLKVNGEEKRVVQLSLKSGLKDNSYPIKSTNLEITVPKIEGKQPTVEKIIRLNNMTKWNYEYDGSIVKIDMSNENEIWKDSGNEEIILTYIYEKDAQIDETKIQATQKIVLYDETNITANQAEVTIRANEEKDMILATEVINGENAIYKGKIYSGIDRQYESKTKIDINLIGVVDTVQIKENASTYQPTNEEANIYYKQTKINKKELIDILGEENILQIIDQNGNELANIDSTAETDENGNIVIDYADKTVKSITIKFANPIKAGTINLNHTKVIKETAKESTKQANKIVTKITQNYNETESEIYTRGIELEKEQEIELKETSTQATISMSKNNLSTLTTNNVEINAILKSSKEENDLYKNPKIQIILPKEVEDIKVNSINKLYADEFQVTKAGLEEIPDVGKVIEIDLVGEQTKYLGEISGGIQIVINANIKLNKAVPTGKTSLVMKYTNENGEQPEYEASEELSVVSKYGVLVYSKVSGYNEENTLQETINNENLKGKLDVAKAERIMTVERNIINNYEDEVGEIEIIGHIAQIGEEKINEETLKSTFTPTLDEINTNNENVKIYYSVDGQQWSEDTQKISEMKFYKIELPEGIVQPGEKITILSKIKIPENLELDQSTYETMKVSYQYKEQVHNEEYATYLATNVNNDKVIEVEKQEEPQAGEEKSLGSIIVKATTAGKELKDGEEIYEGQTVKETVTLTNDTGEDLNNIKITVKQDNGIFYTKKVTQSPDSLNGGMMDVTRIQEDETIDKKEYTLETLKSGEEKTLEYQFSVKEKPGEKTTGTIVIEADGIESKTITTTTNPIKDADLKLNVESGYNEEREIIAGGTLPVVLTIKNISEKEIKDAIIELPIPEYATFDESYLMASDEIEYIGVENQTVKFRIKTLEKQQQTKFSLSFIIDDFEEDKENIQINYTVNYNNINYFSNYLVKEVEQINSKISVMQVGSVNGTTLRDEDDLIYTVTISNESDKDQYMEIEDYVPDAAVINTVKMVKEGETSILEGITENKIEYETTLKGNEEMQLIIETTIDEGYAVTDTLTNVVGVNLFTKYIKSNEVTYRLEDFENNEDEDNNNEEPGDDNPGSEEPGNEEPGENNTSNGKISGSIWLDEDKNGKRETNEKLIENVTVKLINSQTEKEIAQTKTDKNGKYEFTKIPNGQYMVIFEYNTVDYSLTEYKKTGVNEENNSDAIAKDMNGQIVGITDIIQINNNELNNIDVGLVENKIFDLKLNKSISRVIIQNASATKTSEYNKAQLVKAEIDSKQINNCTVIVEYQIDITNEGEIPGYATEIVDYIPNDFKFNSEINKSWYTTDGNTVHNMSLSKELIKPGETRTLTLTLVKTMTEDNTGTSINTAEIVKANNEQLIPDKDSTPANRASGEDDMSTAQLIISLRTGAIYIIGAVVATILIGLAVVVVIIVIKKRRDINE